MQSLILAAVLFVMFLAGLLALHQLRARRKSRILRQSINRDLGFLPVEPDPILVEKIAGLARSIRRELGQEDPGEIRLQDVFTKKLPDCDLFLYDLIRKSGGEESFSESRSIAVISSHLRLPPFWIFPKSDAEGAISDLGNKFLGWIFSRFGNVIDFPDAPEFSQHYLVSSPDPQPVRQFLDTGRLHRLAKIRLMSVQAAGDAYTVSRVGDTTRPVTQEAANEQVKLALELYSIFLS